MRSKWVTFPRVKIPTYVTMEVTIMHFSLIGNWFCFMFLDLQ